MRGSKLITNNGKQLISKYLLGQAPSYGSYIAAGVGSKALSEEETIIIPANKDSLDFEVFRVPITSKGFIKEDGVEKIIFKAEMPSEQRYQITELGVYPAIGNSVAGKYDSKLLISFTPNEQWSYFIGGSGSAVPYPNEALDSDNANSNLSTNLEDILFINSDATIFNNEVRKDRNEPPRFLNRSLMVGGSTSFLSSTFISSANSASLENGNLSFDLGQNLPNDKLKIALSLVSRLNSLNENPDSVRIKLEFINNISGITSVSPKATLKISLTSEDFIDEFDNIKRYIIVQKTLSEFTKDDNFSWSNINYIKIYSTVIVDDEPSDDYYIIFDGIRLDNLTSENPLYSLFSYNIIKTEDAYPILKQENTSNYIEYRFGIGVDG
jgi:hypothetical protein